jgi:hydrogenase maturation factor
MCNSIIARIVDVKGKEATAKIKNSLRKINVELINVKKDDYVLLAANVAIEKLDPEEARLAMGNFNESKK